METAFAVKHTRYNSIAIVHPSVRAEGDWQLTRVDEYGPYSDSQCPGRREASKMARQEGFKVPMSEAEVNEFIINAKR